MRYAFALLPPSRSTLADRPGRDQPVFIISWALASLVILLYWPVTGYGFINYDDPLYVTGNPWVNGGLSWNSLRWASTAMLGGNWHPLTLLSHMVDCQLFGLEPGGHHLVSVLIHAANAVLLFVVLWWATSAAWPSAFVAALFAVHPLNVQSVAWISERKNVLSTFFWLLTTAAYLRYARQPGGRRYLLVLLLFVLGLMSKAMLVTLPFTLLLLDYWPLGRWRPGDGARGAGRLVLEKAPLFVVALTAGLIAIMAQQTGDTVFSLAVFPLPMRVANGLVAYATYIKMMCWPAGLAAFYPHPGASLPLARVILALLALSLVTVFVFKSTQNRPYLVVGWLWYLGTLVPVIGLVQVGSQALADRYAYVPLIGVFVMIVWWLDEIRERSNLGTALTAAGLFLLVALGMGTRQQLRPWRDSVTLFEHAIARTKNNYLAHNNLGTALLREGRLDEALVEFARAVEANPGFLESEYNLATALIAKDRLEEAVIHLRRALRLNPEDAASLNNLAAAYIRMRRFEEAVPPLLRALELKPDYVDAANNLNAALSQSRKRLDGVPSGKGRLQ